MAHGNAYGVCFAPDRNYAIVGINGAGNTFALAALNSCIAYRFMARDTRNVYSINIYWTAVATPGTVQVRIETVDAATGKPTGTLYDANATISVTPTAGEQTCTFAVHPTTGLVAGNLYAVVVIATAAGTTQTIAAGLNQYYSFPAAVLSATDGTTRSNLAEVSLLTPTLSYVMSDGAEELFGANTAYSSNTYAVYGTRGLGAKFTLAGSLEIGGFVLESGCYPTSATPAGDLKIVLRDSGSNAVTGGTATLPKQSFYGATYGSHRVAIQLPAAITVVAGTYRISFENSNHATGSGDNYTLAEVSVFSSATLLPAMIASETSDVTATPIVWTDTAKLICAGLILEDTVASAGGSSGIMLPLDFDGGIG